MHRCSCLYVSARVHVRECPRPDRGVCVAQSILMKHGSNVPVCVVMSAIEGRILTVWHSYCSNLRRISVSVCVYTCVRPGSKRLYGRIVKLGISGFNSPA